MRSPRFIAALAALSLALLVPGMSTAANADPSTVEGFGKVLDDYSYYGVSSTVRAYKADPRTSSAAPVATDVTTDGYFDFPALTAGATWLKVTPTGADAVEKVVGPFQVMDSDYYFGDVVLKARVGTFSGKVVDGQQVGYSCAYLELYDSRGYYSGTQTNAAGTFAMTLRPGTYKVLMGSYCSDFNSYWIGGVDQESATGYSVTADKATAVPTIAINYGTSISGKVTSDAVAGAPSIPLRNIDVTALQYDTGSESWQSRGSVSTGSDGTYRLRDVQPGDYVLRFSDDEGEFVEEYFASSATLEDATTVTVGASGVTGKNVSLASQPVDTTGVLLSGVVKNRYGTGIDDIEVNLYNIGQDRWVDDTDTNRRGRFSFKDIEPGDYYVSFDDDRERYITDATTRLRVKVGTTKGADISKSLVAFGRVSGIVALPASTSTVWNDGQAVLFNESGDMVDSDWFEAGEGYSFGYLKPGRYKLRFSGNQYRSGSSLPLIGQWWSKKYSMDSATTITIGDASVVKGVNVALTQQLAAIAAPKVSGTAKRGKTLRTTVGAWNGVAGNKYAYAWFRNGKAIKGATKSSYKLTKADRRKLIKVRVTASNAANGWKSGATFSASKRVAKK